MKIIVSHKDPDFDSFASSIAAKRLYPDFEVVLSGTPNKNLKEFLEIHSEFFSYLLESQIDESETIDEIIIVDTSSKERLGDKIGKLVEKAKKITVFDHHPETKLKSIKAHDFIVKEIGATTTILVKEVMEKHLKIKNIEATLFAIGIYEDTGNFIYSSTTPEDLKIAAWLLENGANLTLINDFVSLELTHEQQELLSELLNNLKAFSLNEISIYLAVAEREKYIGGVGFITSKLLELTGYDAVFSVVRMGRRVYVVGRGTSDELDIGKAMEEIGGGGHRKAGSAAFKDIEINDVIEKLINSLRRNLIPVLRARDIMSSPVRTVLSNMTVEEVNKIMDVTGHNGLPVIEGNRLVGIVVKRDVVKALKHNLNNAPVKSIMSTNLVVVSPDIPVSEIRKLMVEKGVGRVPVIENGILIGIITKTDIIRSLHNVEVKELPAKITTHEEKLKSYDITSKMKNQLSKDIFNLLRLLGNVGDELKMPVYLVGGFVRDLLLDVENYDIDIVVEGNAIDYAHKLEEYFNVRVIEHEKFGTAIVIFKDYDLRVDVATARIEYYEAPAELPKVELSTIKKDLYRRDFSINAMAVKLNPSEFGKLLDFFGCREDLENGIIRVLYNLSFVEDPTRILRAVRFEQRYNFRIEERTQELLKNAVENGYIEKVTGQRLREEFEKLLDEPDPLKAIRRLAEFNVIIHMFPKTYYTKTMDEKLERMFNFSSIVDREISENLNKFYAVMYIFLEYYTDRDLMEVKERYGLSGRYIKEMKELWKVAQIIPEFFGKGMKFSDIYKVVGKRSLEGYYYLASYMKEEQQKIFNEYIRKVGKTSLIQVNGKLLIDKYGFKPGEDIKRILEEIYCAKLDGVVNDQNEEEYLKTIINK
ncbi:MAG: hypothetical protein PWQ20_897 [Thermotogaceae bacterium]|nr:hypothetical protein [Thermotogaceae bacterium]